MLKSLLIATTALVAIPAFAADVTDNAWFKAGQEAIAAKMAAQPNTGRAKNVIILIADGKMTNRGTGDRSARYHP